MDLPQLPRPPQLQRPNVFAAETLDRAAARRRDAAWIAEAFEAARLVLVWDARMPSVETGFVAASRAQLAGLDGVAWEDAVFLGLEDGAPWFAVSLAADSSAADAAARAIAPEGRFRDLRTLGLAADAATANRLATARAYTHWHASHRRCSVCGGPTVAAQAGHQRRCVDPGCGAVEFPRTDPAVIMLAHDGAGSCVLGRQPNWPPGMYSTLAGFVEPGESLEDAVIRETAEECGLTPHRVAYHSSQPWPFPRSLMVGFFAEMAHGSLTPDPEELEDVRWFTAAEVADIGRLGLSLPSKLSIARRLIESWLADQGLAIVER